MLLLAFDEIQQKLSSLKLNRYGYVTPEGVEILRNEQFPSLQEASFKHHIDTLNIYLEVLKAIYSITRKPYTTNDREETVRRADTAGLIGNQEFLRTTLSPNFWKRDRSGRLKPEFVYKEENIDTIVNQENLFIRFLIDVIKKDITGYQKFCLAFLPKIVDGIFTPWMIPQETFTDSFKKCQKILHYINRLERTEFCKVLSVKRFNPRSLRRTNVLTKNPLYSYCYKFYINHLSNMFSYEGRKAYSDYTAMLFVKALIDLGYELDKQDVFVNGDTKIRITPSFSTFQLSFVHQKLPFKEIMVHYAFLEEDREGEVEDLAGVDDYRFTFYHLFNMDEETRGRYEVKDELTLIKDLIYKTAYLHPIHDDLYEHFCPRCQGMNVRRESEDQRVYVCPDCSERYAIISRDDNRYLLDLGQMK